MKNIFASAPIDEELIRLEVEPHLDEKPLNFEKVKDIHGKSGVSHSTVYIRETLLKCKKNRAFIKDIEAAADFDTPDFEFVIVPGMFYIQHPKVGGDGTVFRLIAERLKVPCETVPLKPLGSISENAETLVKFFERSNKPRWLLSMSKGTADLKRALSLLPPGSFNSIQGILNVSGVHGGTRLVKSRKGTRLEHLLMKIWMKAAGADPAILKEMHTEHSFSKEEYRLPSHIEVINIFGLPLPSHIRKPLINNYRYLMDFGPNDGYVLTEDALIPSNKNIFFWGADHYLRTPELNVRIEQLLRWISSKSS